MGAVSIGGAGRRLGIGDGMVVRGGRVPDGNRFKNVIRSIFMWQWLCMDGNYSVIKGGTTGNDTRPRRRAWLILCLIGWKIPEPLWLMLAGVIIGDPHAIGCFYRSC